MPEPAGTDSGLKGEAKIASCGFGAENPHAHRCKTLAITKTLEIHQIIECASVFLYINVKRADRVKRADQRKCTPLGRLSRVNRPERLPHDPVAKTSNNVTQEAG